MQDKIGGILLGIGWVSTLTLTELGAAVGIFSGLAAGTYYIIKSIREIKEINNIKKDQ